MAERFFQNTIALVYDFDGTLSPQPMQEYTVLPKIGVEPSQFWARVNREARETESDPMLVYMRHIIEAVTESINEHMPESQRPIPFHNIIYMGDGMSDVPSMALTKKSGGHGVAVYDPKKPGGRASCVKLLDAGRVDFIAEADHARGSKLSRRVELLLDSIIANIAYSREAFRARQENRGKR